jgi:hypothetical protein
MNTLLRNQILQDTHAGTVNLEPRWLKVDAAVAYRASLAQEKIRSSSLRSRGAPRGIRLIDRAMTTESPQEIACLTRWIQERMKNCPAKGQDAYPSNNQEMNWFTLKNEPGESGSPDSKEKPIITNLSNGAENAKESEFFLYGENEQGPECLSAWRCLSGGPVLTVVQAISDHALFDSENPGACSCSRPTQKDSADERLHLSTEKGVTQA